MALPRGQARQERRRQMQDAACSAMVPPMSRPKGAGKHPPESRACREASRIAFQLMHDTTVRLKTLRVPMPEAGGGGAGGVVARKGTARSLRRPEQHQLSTHALRSQ